MELRYSHTTQDGTDLYAWFNMDGSKALGDYTLGECFRLWGTRPKKNPKNICIRPTRDVNYN